jgi:PPOX class probable F420-dependent enzyme
LITRDKATAWLARQRVARLATADARRRPHVIPVCFALSGNRSSLYITVDEKPKDDNRLLKRIRNLLENPQAALVADYYSEEWDQLGWVMVRGRGDILSSGAEHTGAQVLLTWKYPQYRNMTLEPLPVIALRINRWSWWGRIDG